jgi:PIN domain nuclease of toxin-antitoxin system
LTAFLLDTNALLFIAGDQRAMTAEVREILFASPLFVSVISAAEMSIKMTVGKLTLPPPFMTDFGGALRALLERSQIDLLPLDLPTIEHLRLLPLHHRDPFDRIIIAQAFALGLTVATRDRAFRAYDGLNVLEV